MAAKTTRCSRTQRSSLRSHRVLDTTAPATYTNSSVPARLM
jgi:hypothetical protein